ncbi:MAG: ExbD/TolR family protein [Planctomycetaceae bacterium]
MRIPSYVHQNANQERPAMTSMIDVVFLLLIFFICASVGMTREDLMSTFLSSGVSTSIAVEKVEQPLGEVWVKVRVTESGQPVMELESREFEDFDDLQETLSQLAKVAPEIPVILDIASAVRMEDVIRLYDICVQAKFQSIHFATRTPSVQKPKSMPAKPSN